MKIYTKKGDDGNTSILGNKKFSKSDLRICAIGETDELNAHIGLIYSQIYLYKENLLKVLNSLFIIGSQLALEEKGKYKIPEITENKIMELEKAIDSMDAELATMTHFILPTGDLICSNIHIARAVCRRAERSVVALSKEADIDGTIIKYLNRLSDFLFVLSRYYCLKNNLIETKWIP